MDTIFTTEKVAYTVKYLRCEISHLHSTNAGQMKPGFGPGRRIVRRVAKPDEGIIDPLLRGFFAEAIFQFDEAAGKEMLDLFFAQRAVSHGCFSGC